MYACARGGTRLASRVAVPGDAPKLLDRVRIAIRVRHYSRRTEQAYVDWIRRFIVFHRKTHPSEMGAAEIAAFLSWLAVRRQVSVDAEPGAECAAVSLPSCVGKGRRIDRRPSGVRAGPR